MSGFLPTKGGSSSSSGDGVVDELKVQVEMTTGMMMKMMIVMMMWLLPMGETDSV